MSNRPTDPPYVGDWEDIPERTKRTLPWTLSQKVQHRIFITRDCQPEVISRMIQLHPDLAELDKLWERLYVLPPTE